MRAWIVLLCLAASAAAQSLEDRIRDLGADEWAVREEATRVLVDRAGEVWPELARAAGDADLEVARRARAVRARAARIADGELQAIFALAFSPELQARLDRPALGWSWSVQAGDVQEPSLGRFETFVRGSFGASIRLSEGASAKSHVAVDLAPTIGACLDPALGRSGLVFVEEGRAGLAVLTVEEALADERVLAALGRAVDHPVVGSSARVLLASR